MSERNIGLACAGGGVEGAIFEIGALCALDEALDGARMHQLGVYVGVSAGALVASCLANGIPARDLSRAIISQADEPALNITPETLFAPALREYARRLARLPGALGRSALAYLRNPWDLSPVGALTNLAEAVPVGLFDNAPLERHLATIFAAEGRTNDFRTLEAVLRVVAVNVDTAALAVFGAEGAAHVPISKAVQASTALPGLYLPVEIDGTRYIDGVARRTVHASAALDAGAELLFCLNPLVPVSVEAAGDGAAPPSLTERGLPTVLSQAFRTLVHSRRATGFRSYEHLYPGSDIVLIEPTPEDYRRIFSNLFSFSNRHAVCEYAYQAVRRHLHRHADALAPVLARHGLRLRRAVLADETRTLYAPRPGHPALRRAADVLDDLGRVLDDLSERPAA